MIYHAMPPKRIDQEKLLISGDANLILTLETRGSREYVHVHMLISRIPTLHLKTSLLPWPSSYDWTHIVYNIWLEKGKIFYKWFQ